MIDEATIQKAVKKLLDAAPGSTVILFGSYARGQVTEHSDLDFLVVMPGPIQRHKEMVRLRDVIGYIGVPVDVLVVSREAFEKWKSVPNNMIFEAAKEGRVVDVAA